MIGNPEEGLRVSFDCHDGCSPHVGTITSLQDITPTLSLVTMVDDKGEQFTVTAYDPDLVVLA
jgi:hypothetical protein